jgi:pimeloyl-ACP methyl ester carboxylesterase
MKRRAGEVGERFAREWVAPLWRALSRPPRLHLIGHSFGATLVTSMALGGVRPASLTLLLAAFSAFAFAPSIPWHDYSPRRPWPTRSAIGSCTTLTGSC